MGLSKIKGRKTTAADDIIPESCVDLCGTVGLLFNMSCSLRLGRVIPIPKTQQPEDLNSCKTVKSLVPAYLHPSVSSSMDRGTFQSGVVLG